MSDTLQRRSVSPSPLLRPVTPPGLGATIRVSPSEFNFQVKANHSVLVGRVSLRSMAADAPIGFKFKTNAPERYTVRPVLGVLPPTGDSIEIFARCDGEVEPDDRFMIESITLTEEETNDLSSKKWRSFDRRRIVENFIPCRTPGDARLISQASTSTLNALAMMQTQRSSLAASPRLRSQLHHSRAPSLELPMSRRANAVYTTASPGSAILPSPHASATTFATAATATTNSSSSSSIKGPSRSTSPVRRPPIVMGIVGTGPNTRSGGYTSDVEVGLDRDKRLPHRASTGSASRENRKRRQHVDKGLVDVLPQILLLVLACIIVAFWVPVHRWLVAFFVPWLQSTEPILPMESATAAPSGPTPANPMISVHA